MFMVLRLTLSYLVRFQQKGEHMNKDMNKKPSKPQIQKKAPNFTKPVWGDMEMSCGECSYNGQDIDTFPCAKCHTRH